MFIFVYVYPHGRCNLHLSWSPLSPRQKVKENPSIKIVSWTAKEGESAHGDTRVNVNCQVSESRFALLSGKFAFYISIYIYIFVISIGQKRKISPFNRTEVGKKVIVFNYSFLFIKLKQDNFWLHVDSFFHVNYLYTVYAVLEHTYCWNKSLVQFKAVSYWEWC